MAIQEDGEGLTVERKNYHNRGTGTYRIVHVAHAQDRLVLNEEGPPPTDSVGGGGIGPGQGQGQGC